MLQRWGMLAIGLGIGLIAGMNVGQVLVIPGLVAIAAGAGMVGFGSRGRGEPAEPSAPGTRPSSAGLGTRVEDLLRIAEAQAKDHVEDAERQAARIIADAREEATRLR